MSRNTEGMGTPHADEVEVAELNDAELDDVAGGIAYGGGGCVKKPSQDVEPGTMHTM